MKGFLRKASDFVGHGAALGEKTLLGHFNKDAPRQGKLDATFFHKAQVVACCLYDKQQHLVVGCAARDAQDSRP